MIKRLLPAALVIALITLSVVPLQTNVYAQESRVPRLFGKRQTRFDDADNNANDTITTNEQQRQETLRLIPFEKFDNEIKSRIALILSRPSIYRRLTEQNVACSQGVFTLMVSHPDIVISIWEKLGSTQIALREVGKDKFKMEESSGTTATAEVIYRSDELVIAYIRGVFRAALLPKGVEGETVIVLRNKFSTDENGVAMVNCRLDAFVNVNNHGADLVAKLITPMITKVADGNFEQTIEFVGSVSDAIIINPANVYRMSTQLQHINESTRYEFQQLITAATLAQYRLNITNDPSQIQSRLIYVPEQKSESYTPTPIAYSATPEPVEEKRADDLFQPFLEPGKIISTNLDNLATSEIPPEKLKQPEPKTQIEIKPKGVVFKTPTITKSHSDMLIQNEEL
ncbi:MAG: hypothetical protein LBU65_12385 [Planctomycetaceae bacterium]|nr:hypothetical protein [Planctomycetaceae bacterium]